MDVIRANIQCKKTITAIVTNFFDRVFYDRSFLFAEKEWLVFSLVRFSQYLLGIWFDLWRTKSVVEPPIYRSTVISVQPRAETPKGDQIAFRD